MKDIIHLLLFQWRGPHVAYQFDWRDQEHIPAPQTQLPNPKPADPGAYVGYGQEKIYYFPSHDPLFKNITICPPPEGPPGLWRFDEVNDDYANFVICPSSEGSWCLAEIRAKKGPEEVLTFSDRDLAIHWAHSTGVGVLLSEDPLSTAYLRRRTFYDQKQSTISAYPNRYKWWTKISDIEPDVDLVILIANSSTAREKMVDLLSEHGIAGADRVDHIGRLDRFRRQYKPLAQSMYSMGYWKRPDHLHGGNMITSPTVLRHFLSKESVRTPVYVSNPVVLPERFLFAMPTDQKNVYTLTDEATYYSRLISEGACHFVGSAQETAIIDAHLRSCGYEEDNAGAPRGEYLCFTLGSWKFAYVREPLGPPLDRKDILRQAEIKPAPEVAGRDYWLPPILAPGDQADIFSPTEKDKILRMRARIICDTVGLPQKAKAYRDFLKSSYLSKWRVPAAIIRSYDEVDSLFEMEVMKDVVGHSSFDGRLFVRMCPFSPNHGNDVAGHQSRVVKIDGASAYIKKVQKDLLHLAPDACIMVMPFIEAPMSAVMSAHAVSIGNGTDGVTAGTSVRWTIPVQSPLHPITKALGMSPYTTEVELLLLNRCHPDGPESWMSRSLMYSWHQAFQPCTPFLVQFRKAPQHNVRQMNPRPSPSAMQGFVGKSDQVHDLVLVKSLNDLSSLDQATENSLIVQPTGSLLSHAAAHARAIGASFVVADLDWVPSPPFQLHGKGTWVDLEEITGSSEKDAIFSEENKKAFFEGLDYARAQWGPRWVYLSLFFHLWLSGLEASDRCAFLAGCFVGWLVMAGTAASLGESRRALPECKDHVVSDHMREAVSRFLVVEKQRVSSNVERKAMYETFMRHFHSWEDITVILKTLAYGFSAATWTTSFGGSKWATATREVLRIVGLITEQASLQEIVKKANRLENMAHNTGWLYNKFVSKDALDVGTMTFESPGDLYRAFACILCGEHVLQEAKFHIPVEPTKVKGMEMIFRAMEIEHKRDTESGDKIKQYVSHLAETSLEDLQGEIFEENLPSDDHTPKVELNSLDPKPSLYQVDVDWDQLPGYLAALESKPPAKDAVWNLKDVVWDTGGAALEIKTDIPEIQ